MIERLIKPSLRSTSRANSTRHLQKKFPSSHKIGRILHTLLAKKQTFQFWSVLCGTTKFGVRNERIDEVQ